ncbi:AMP-binding protein [candidate division KSB1 bacterium]|nr:AMP-binding protein [candidate division KSB1 bacterium]
MFQSVPHMLFQTIEHHGKKDALRYRKNGQLIRYTYDHFGDQIRYLTHGLASAGLKSGDKIAILSNNRPEWTISDFATFALRAIVVPIYQTLPANQIRFILNDCGARAIFVEDQSQFDKIISIKNELPKLKFVFAFDDLESDEQQVIYFDQLILKGEKHRQVDPDFFDETLDEIDPEDICSIVYTSGTTGNPKGVMLHHKGFITDIINSEARLNLFPEDVFLSFLPLSHLYERLAGHWCPMYRGGTIHYARSIDTVVEDIADAKPTVMVSVPRLYEKIANAVMAQVQQGSFLKKKIFYWALRTGLEYHRKKIDKAVSPSLERKYRLADKLAFSKIKKKLGGNFRYPIAGGAPLSVETLKFFEAIGLRIIEGYGMTETHLIITLTPFGKTKYGSCGKPIDGVQVKITDDGEVLIKGETLMAGYYNQPELTKEVIDEDGWLHTGDIGHLDDEQFLFLTDRKKNILVTSGGKNVASAPIENKLKTSPFIEDICLIGDHRKFVSAIIVPVYDQLKKWAAEQGLRASDNEALVKHEAVRKMVLSEIEDLQSEFARYEKVKKIILLAEPLSIERGELTPSLKIKRNVVLKRYKEEIDALYAEE